MSSIGPLTFDRKTISEKEAKAFVDTVLTPAPQIHFHPRGLVNFRQTCFASSVLQALVGCDDFAQTMMSMAAAQIPLAKGQAPFLAEMLSFVNDYRGAVERKQQSGTVSEQKRSDGSSNTPTTTTASSAQPGTTVQSESKADSTVQKEFKPENAEPVSVKPTATSDKPAVVQQQTQSFVSAGATSNAASLPAVTESKRSTKASDSASAQTSVQSQSQLNAQTQTQTQQQNAQTQGSGVAKPGKRNRRGGRRKKGKKQQQDDDNEDEGDEVEEQQQPSKQPQQAKAKNSDTQKGQGQNTATVSESKANTAPPTSEGKKSDASSDSKKEASKEPTANPPSTTPSQTATSTAATTAVATSEQPVVGSQPTSIPNATQLQQQQQAPPASSVKQADQEEDGNAQDGENDDNDNDNDNDKGTAVSKSARRRHRKRLQALTQGSSQQPSVLYSAPVPVSTPQYQHQQSLSKPSNGMMMNGNSYATVNTGPLRPPIDAMLAHFQKHAIGRQEDAHEFFTFLLTELHDDMMHLAQGRSLAPSSLDLDLSDSELAFLGLKPGSDNSGRQSQGQSSNNNAANDDSDKWQEVGKNNRKRIVQSELKLPPSPVTSTFGGRIRTVLSKHAHNMTDSISLQPFFSLHLDISASETDSVAKALQLLVSSAAVEGYKRQTTKTEIRASQQTTIETLPRVLVLHLKRFTFSETGSNKITKHISYEQLLTLQPEWLFGPALAESKSNKLARTYQLRAVIVHHGARPSGGHYTCYVRYPSAASSSGATTTSDAKDSKSSGTGSGSGSNPKQTSTSTSAVDPNSGSVWYHLDDTTINRVGASYVLQQQAYLLFYSRMSVP